MNVRNLTVAELLAAISEPSPTPGGGSASALAASLGLALLTMVARMKRTRTGTDTDRRALDAAADALAPMRDRAAALADEDRAAYDAVVAAYRLSKASAEAQDRRRTAVQAALRGAAEVPLEVVRLCQAGVTRAMEVGGHGNPSAASDVGVALELLVAGARGAALNVRANLGAISDAGYTESAGDALASLETSIGDLLEQARARLSSA